MIVSDPRKTITRVVATAGPRSYDTIEKIIEHGTVRINLSFQKSAKDIADRVSDIARIRAHSVNRINVMLDAVGPRVKLGPLPLEGIPLPLGAARCITSDVAKAKGDIILTYFPLHLYVKPKERILLAEGKFACVVDRVEGMDVHVTVSLGGQLLKRGINLPDTDLEGLPALSEEDKVTIAAIIKDADVDMIALSFVRTPSDIEVLRAFLREQGKTHIKIMAKIETQMAVDLIDGIAAVSDALMVARGDLWCELRDMWTLPMVTCDIINAGRARGIPVITATQVCSSMATQSIPTRAEVDELYFLLKEGSDCIMGSEEFGIGLFPRETADAFRKMGELLYNAPRPPRGTGRIPLALAPHPEEQSTSSCHAQRVAAVQWAESSPRIACIVVVSVLGKTARELYRERPSKPLIVITNTPSTARYLQLFQVTTVFMAFDGTSPTAQEVASMAMPLLAKMYGGGDMQKTALLLSHKASGDTLLFAVEEMPLS